MVSTTGSQDKQQQVETRMEAIVLLGRALVRLRLGGGEVQHFNLLLPWAAGISSKFGSLLLRLTKEFMG
jgi:hypothetical protein